MLPRTLTLLLALTSVASAQTYVDGTIVSGPTPSAPKFLASPTITTQFPNPQGSSYASGIAWFNNEVWCAGAFTSTIIRADATNGNTLGSFSAPQSGMRGVLHDGTSLWVSDWGTKNVYELDPLNGAVRSQFNTGFGNGHPNGIALDGQNLVISDELQSIYWFTKAGVPVKSLALQKISGASSDPRGLAIEGNVLYAGYQSLKVVNMFDLTTGQQVDSFASPSGIVFQQGVGLGSPGSVWITGGTNCMVYEMSFVPYWQDLGNALAGTTLPQLVGIGTLAAGTQADLELTNALPGSTAGLVLGVTQLNAPFYGGMLVPYPNILLLGIPTGTGQVKLSGIMPSPVPSGIPIFAQYWIADPLAPFGYSASNGVSQSTP